MNIDAAATVTAVALMFPVPTDEEWAKREASWVESDSVTAWDGDRCVGSAHAFTVDTTVPGGERLPMSRGDERRRAADVLRGEDCCPG